MQVKEAIHKRHAVRLFKDQPVPEDIIRAILEAGRRSQSSKNTQPWQFIVVRDRSTLKALSETGKFASHLAGAAFAVVLAGATTGNWVSFDLGQAAAQMQLAAWEDGVGSCIAAIYEPEKARQILGIPPEMSIMAALSFGFPSPEHKPAKMGGRRPLDEITHWDRW